MKTRLYTDDSELNQVIDLKHMHQQIHALFCQWVKSNYHVRDFIAAIEHEATWIFTQYLMEGSPQFSSTQLLPDHETLLSLDVFVPSPAIDDALKPRFYTAEGTLNPEVNFDEEYRAAMVQMFAGWVFRNYHARDFIQAARDCAVGTYHRYSTMKALDGLGGASVERFLTTRPKSN